MRIDSDFDGGSILVLDLGQSEARLALREDSVADYRQWFYFWVHGVEGTPCTFAIEDAVSSSFPGGWSGYRACASYDGDTWFRVPTGIEGGALVIRHTPERPDVAYACFAPYVTERYDDLMGRVGRSPRARVEEIGKSVEGRPLHVVTFGSEDRPVHRLWIIAHQHPGETMAAFCVEGLIDRLLDPGDAAAAALIDQAVVHVVPRMNPDGSAHGNHRTNAAGRDLNREWTDPSMEASPEVFLVRRALEERGVDLFVDIHGEESIPYVFAFGIEGIPRYGDRLAGLEEMFREALERASASFQREHGYDRDPPGEGDLRLATDWVAQEHDCLAVGIELPFKDDADHPDEAVGWSPDRSRGLGRSLVEALLACVGSLR
jgi:murein tripeptide amidase MpaA